jgi:hypothetical protein
MFMTRWILTTVLRMVMNFKNISSIVFLSRGVNNIDVVTDVVNDIYISALYFHFW